MGGSRQKLLREHARIKAKQMEARVGLCDVMDEGKKSWCAERLAMYGEVMPDSVETLSQYNDTIKPFRKGFAPELGEKSNAVQLRIYHSKYDMWRS